MNSLRPEQAELESRIAVNFPCWCPPYRAVYRGYRGPRLMLVHHISCDRPRTERATQSLMITHAEADMLSRNRYPKLLAAPATAAL